MKFTRLVCLFLFMQLVGCSAFTPDRYAIRDKWIFVALEKTALPMIPPPPRFDTLEFKDGQSLQIGSTTKKDDFPATYTLKGNTLTYQFQPSDVPDPIIHQVELRFMPYKSGLLLKNGDEEYIYYRSRLILPNDIAGLYAARGDGPNETLKLNPDGSFEMKESKTFGQYRLWYHYPQGKLMTMMMFIPEEGWAVFTFQVKETKTGLTQSQIVGGRAMKEGAVIWDLVEKEK